MVDANDIISEVYRAIANEVYTSFNNMLDED